MLPINEKRDESATGYISPIYSFSLLEFGLPLHLKNSKGWILLRDIPGFIFKDAMGCYPLFACDNWKYLGDDLAEAAPDLVSLTLVTDPFGNFTTDLLTACFSDLMIPFKEHFVVDLDLSPESFVCKHHLRCVRKASRTVEVEVSNSPSSFTQEWVALYSNLIRRHKIKGIAAFSAGSLEKQLKVPGAVMLRGVHRDTILGALLWYVQGDVAYYHLGAYSDLGYESKVSFILFWRALDYFKRSGVKWLDLGAGSGLNPNSDGLTRFKRGWSNKTKTAFLCGKIFDKNTYDKIVKMKNIGDTNYFPAYRINEFG